MDQVRIAVVIVTFNGARWIADCLTSLLASNVTCTIIVVDNCSTDDTVPLVNSSFPGVVLIRNKRNEGFGQANNAGIVHALGMKMDYIFLLNQDTTVQPDTIASLIDSIKGKANRFAIASPLHLSDNATEFDEGFYKFLNKSLTESEIDQMMKGGDASIIEVDFVNAAAWLVPADVFLVVGGFAPLFFHYGEDRDFVNRIRYHGYRIGVVPRSRIQHYRGDRTPVSGWRFEKKVHYYYINWLSRAAGINTTLVSGFFSGLVWACKESLFYLIRGVPSVAIASMVAFRQMLRVLPDMVSHRRTVKRAGSPHFLKIGKSE